MGPSLSDQTTVSVALCTYNGARFLEAQLDSIAAQTILPDELIIRDDGSTDATLSVAERFAQKALFPVSIAVNSQRCGPAGNFAACLAACTSELVVLSDQDDIWMPDRIAQTIAAYRDRQVMFTYADAELIDAQARPIGRTIFTTVPISRNDRRLLTRGGDLMPLILRYGVLYGATMSVRRSLIDLATPFPEGWSHDEWLSLVGAAAGRGVPTVPVIQYRQHAAQVVGAGAGGFEAVITGARGKRPDHYAAEQHRYEAAQGIASRHPLLVQRLLPQLRAKTAFLATRRTIHAGGMGALPAIGKTLWHGDHSRFSSGVRSIARDVYFAARMTLARVRPAS